MVFSIGWAALRRRPFSCLCTVVLCVISAALMRLPVPVALLVWVAASLLGLEVWLLVEPFVLERCGCRALIPSERTRLDASMTRFAIAVRIAEDPAAWIGTGLRTVVVSRGALDSLDDRALLGLLGQVAIKQRAPWLVRAGVVWLGNAPLLVAWSLSWGLGQLGRLLAVVIGSALVLPMLFRPAGFVTTIGRGVGACSSALVGAVLISGGLPGPGLGLLVAWAFVPGIKALLAWEARRAEADADCAAIAEDLGAHLRSALEHLAESSSTRPTRPTGPLGLLVPPGAPLAERINRIARVMDPV